MRMRGARAGSAVAAPAGGGVEAAALAGVAGVAGPEATVVVATAGGAVLAASAAACLLMSCRLMRPVSWMMTRAKKSLSAPLATVICGAVAGASFTSRPLRLRVFQFSSSSGRAGAAGVVWARKSSSVTSPASCTLGPAALVCRATLPR